MWKRFVSRVASVIHPFAMIAQELRALRELYELELSSRTPPIIRVTETPKRTDTEVTYAGFEEKKGSEIFVDEENWE